MFVLKHCGAGFFPRCVDRLAVSSQRLAVVFGHVGESLTAVVAGFIPEPLFVFDHLLVRLATGWCNLLPRGKSACFVGRGSLGLLWLVGTVTREMSFLVIVVALGFTQVALTTLTSCTFVRFGD